MCGPTETASSGTALGLGDHDWSAAGVRPVNWTPPQQSQTPPVQAPASSSAIIPVGVPAAAVSPAAAGGQPGNLPVGVRPVQGASGQPSAATPFMNQAAGKVVA